MRFVCLDYRQGRRRDAPPSGERVSVLEECLAYQDELRRSGHLVAGEELQGPCNAVTMRHGLGRVDVIEGLSGHVAEEVGGILFLEARDLNHAIQLMSRYPAALVGAVEIRAAEPRPITKAAGHRP